MKIVISNEYDATYNLALEEYLIKTIREENIVLFLWQNEKSVIIGRNQNPYMECDMSYADNNRISVVRRMSGGGAVFHDLGNLNYSVIYKKDLLSKEYVTDFVIQSLKDVGIGVNKNGRNDIEIDEKKVSGTAFFHRDGVICQHGCILIKSDLEVIEKVLKPNMDKVVSKGIHSVRARVANITDYNADICVDDVKNALISNFKRLLDSNDYRLKNKNVEQREISPSRLNEREYNEILEKYLSDDWNMRKKIDMRYSIRSRFSWGDCTIVFLTDCAVIKNVYVFSDVLEENTIQTVTTALEGTIFSKDKILKKLRQIMTDANDDRDRDIMSDIIELTIKELPV